MTQRILSAIVIAIIFILATLNATIFYSLFLFILIRALYEWHLMTNKHMSWKLLFFPIILPCIIAILLIRKNYPSNILLIYFIVIWSVDIIAMVGGKTLKGPKLTKISPNKTISGFLCGIFFGAINGAAILDLLKSTDSYLTSSFVRNFICLIIVSISAQISDIFISYFKRKFNIKDFSTIIPGHGGVLDRIDSFILSSILYYLFLQYNYLII